jgi:hypothetical protein
MLKWNKCQRYLQAMEPDKTSIFSLILFIIVSVSIALFAYFLLIHFVVDTDLQTSHREIALLDFYQQPHDQDIVILGSSYVTEGIDAYQVENALREKGINRSVYNLGMQAETPLSRLPELENLIASRPRMVVIGLGYRDLANRTDIYEDRFGLISQRVHLDENYRPFYNDTQADLLTQSSFEHLWYERKFIGGAVFHLVRDRILRENISGREALFDTNFKDPWLLTTNLTEEMKVKKAQEDESQDQIDDNLNPQKMALLSTVNRLRQNNISVIIISMPMNSYYSDRIKDSSRHNFSVFLNETSIPWYDYEREYPSAFFIDEGHMNSAGRTDFSSKVAAIIADSEKKGA